MEVLLHRVGILSFAERRSALDRWVYGLFGCRVARRASGAPYLDSGVPISVSHTGEWLALAVADTGRVCGVDIELVDRRVEGVAARFMSPAERELAPYFPNPGLWVWCAKEALYKASGRSGVDWLRDIRIISGDCGMVCGEFFALFWREEFGLLVVSARST